MYGGATNFECTTAGHFVERLILYEPRPRRRSCIETLGVANLSLAHPYAPLATLQSRLRFSIPRISVCELSSSSLYLILAAL